MDALDIQGVIVDCDLLQNPQLANSAFHFGTTEPNKTKHFTVHCAYCFGHDAIVILIENVNCFVFIT